MPAKNTVRALEMFTFDATTLDPVIWKPLSTIGIPQACFMIRIINDSAAKVEVSYDGTAANDFILANDDLQLSFQHNSRPSNHVALLGKGTVIYVRGTAPMAGDIYLTGYYQQNLE